MEYSFITIAIFSIILFIYLHVFFHLKTSNELELYEIELPSKDKLHEICDLKQPVMFKFDNTYLNTNLGLQLLKSSYGSFDVNVREVDDNEGELYFQLPLNIATKLFADEKEKKYYLEKNADFLKETRLLKHFQSVDELLRPTMVSECNYDLLVGTNNANTCLQYSLDNRNFFYVCEGSITVKLIPPNYSKYLHTENDYTNFEFRSKINPWNVDKSYHIDYNKSHSFDVNVSQGQILFIPNYWWYSIKLHEDSNVLKFTYKTYMNHISIIPQLCLSFLQQSNVKRTENKSSEKIISFNEKIDISNNTISEGNDNLGSTD